MHKTELLLSSLGELIKSSRTLTMDQEALGKSTGMGRNTISAIENGLGANARHLFAVMEQLGLIDDLPTLVNEKLSATNNSLVRKSCKAPEMISRE